MSCWRCSASWPGSSRAMTTARTAARSSTARPTRASRRNAIRSALVVDEPLAADLDELHVVAAAELGREVGGPARAGDRDGGHLRVAQRLALGLRELGDRGLRALLARPGVELQ